MLCVYPRELQDLFRFVTNEGVQPDPKLSEDDDRVYLVQCTAPAPSTYIE